MQTADSPAAPVTLSMVSVSSLEGYMGSRMSILIDEVLVFLSCGMGVCAKPMDRYRKAEAGQATRLCHTRGVELEGIHSKYSVGQLLLLDRHSDIDYKCVSGCIQSWSQPSGESVVLMPDGSCVRPKTKPARDRLADAQSQHQPRGHTVST